jgi:hypothetical protein
MQIRDIENLEKLICCGNKKYERMDIWQSGQKNVDPDHFQTQNPIPKPFAPKLQTYQNT